MSLLIEAWSEPFSRVVCPVTALATHPGRPPSKGAFHARADVLRERLDVLTPELDQPARHPAKPRMTTTATIARGE